MSEDSCGCGCATKSTAEEPKDDCACGCECCGEQEPKAEVVV